MSKEAPGGIRRKGACFSPVENLGGLEHGAHNPQRRKAAPISATHALAWRTQTSAVLILASRPWNSYH